MPMKLQLTLDSPSVEDCLDLVLATRDSVDIVEVGYPLLVEEGLSLVRHVKHAFPDKTVLADAKIFHSGGYVSEKCFEYGADVVSVMGLASDETFRAVLGVAQQHAGHVVGDLAGIEGYAARALELETLGVRSVVVPSGLGADGAELSEVSDLGEAGNAAPLEALHELSEQLSHVMVAVVGHIGMDTIDRVVEAEPDIVLVGRAIVSASDPRGAAAALKAKMC